MQLDTTTPDRARRCSKRSKLSGLFESYSIWLTLQLLLLLLNKIDYYNPKGCYLELKINSMYTGSVRSRIGTIRVESSMELRFFDNIFKTHFPLVSTV